ncbi:hypothetical protein B0H13DRAFT_1854717 [Mycena leptocephala]|nr:hypothetical protein B0H13DRAFT_1854717 [Mycena leptocephala]
MTQSMGKGQSRKKIQTTPGFIESPAAEYAGSEISHARGARIMAISEKMPEMMCQFCRILPQFCHSARLNCPKIILPITLSPAPTSTTVNLFFDPFDTANEFVLIPSMPFESSNNPLDSRPPPAIPRPSTALPSPAPTLSSVDPLIPSTSGFTVTQISAWNVLAQRYSAERLRRHQWDWVEKTGSFLPRAFCDDLQSTKSGAFDAILERSSSFIK